MKKVYKYIIISIIIGFFVLCSMGCQTKVSPIYFPPVEYETTNAVVLR